MKRQYLCLSAALAICLLPGPFAQARDIYVAVNGNDGWTGTSIQPKRTIKNAINAAAGGDVVRVRAGTYSESYIQVKSGVTVVSEDGLHAAKVDAGGSTSFRFENGCTNAEVRGFECYALRNGGSGYYDGLVRAWNSSNIRIRDMKIHDAPRDADSVKIGGSGASTTNILLENCIIYNPANRDPSTTSFQECVDIYPADGVTVRGCWLYHTPEQRGDTLIYAKGGSRNILWENNVFGPRHGDPNGNCSTSAGGPSPVVFPSCEDFIARNNLFLDCNGDGAFGLLSARNVEFYNNIIYNYNGVRAPIEFWSVGTGTNENFTCYNNIFYNSNGKGVYSNRGYMPTVFNHDYNLYYQVPNGGDVNISTEVHSLISVNPLLAAPASPVLAADTRASIVARFKLLEGSPAIDAGISLPAVVLTDLYGIARPMRTAYDIGVHEKPWIGDLDADNAVDVTDLLAFADSWARCAGDSGFNPACDFDGDGCVDVTDLLMLAENWGR